MGSFHYKSIEKTSQTSHCVRSKNSIHFTLLIHYSEMDLFCRSFREKLWMKWNYHASHSSDLFSTIWFSLLFFQQQIFSSHNSATLKKKKKKWITNYIASFKEIKYIEINLIIHISIHSPFNWLFFKSPSSSCQSYQCYSWSQKTSQKWNRWKKKMKKKRFRNLLNLLILN